MARRRRTIGSRARQPCQRWSTQQFQAHRFNLLVRELLIHGLKGNEHFP
jgi:hypothetical protein